MAPQPNPSDTQPLLKGTIVTPNPAPAEPVDVVLKKIRRNVIPLCFAVTFLSYLDRANLGIAARDFCNDLDLSSEAYANGVGIFFVFYSIFQVPSNLILERIGAPLWLGILMIVWGLAASSMAFIKTKGQFVFLRCVLGAAQAGTFPGVWVYLSVFFPEKYRTVPLTLVDQGGVVAQILGAPIGAALLALNGVWGWSGWSWLFFLEGIPSVLLGIWFIMSMPRCPRHAQFLSKKEQDLIEHELSKDTANAPSGTDLISSFVSVATNTNLWLLTMVNFLRDMTTDVALFWTPLWINSLIAGYGLSSTSGKHASCGAAEGPNHDSLVALLTTIPFTCAVATGVTLAWNSDRTNDRKYHIGITYIVAALSFAGLPVVSQMSFLLGFLSLTVTICGVNAPSGMLVALTASYLTHETRAVGLAVLNSVGHLGSYAGSMLVGTIMEMTGSYFHSVVTLSLLLFVGGLFLFALPIGSKYKNKLKGKDSSSTDRASAVEMAISESRNE